MALVTVKVPSYVLDGNDTLIKDSDLLGACQDEIFGYLNSELI